MALTRNEIERYFGRFSYREVGSGLVAPEAGWLARNIVTVQTPWPLPLAQGKDKNGKPRTASRIRCHKLVAERILAVLRDLDRQGLRSLIHSYDGCYVPRHICWDKKHGLSTHAWGMALDINAGEFPYGSLRKQEARLVAAFARQGFLCGQKSGGLWRTTVDAMHFEIVKI
jgi:hypothetical protein